MQAVFEEGIFSVILLLMFMVLASWKHGFALIGTICAALSLFGRGLNFWTFYTFTILLIIVCMLTGAKPKMFRICCALIMLGNCTMLSLPLIAEATELQKKRAKFPMVSLAERLAYEKTATSTQVSSVEGRSPDLADSVSKNLLRRDDSPSDWRSWELGQLHSENVDNFAASEGFGDDRVQPRRGLRRGNIILPPRELIAVKRLPDFKPNDASSSGKETPFSSDPDLLDDHRHHQANFFERLGYARDVNHVVGFESHGFSKWPDLTGRFASWAIVQLELVSILRHSTPRAYISQNLPNLDELKQAPTRSLTQFETDALARLMNERDLLIHEKGNEIQMLGSLRASYECLKCHSVRSGALLGALSYRLVYREHLGSHDEGDDRSSNR